MSEDKSQDSKSTDEELAEDGDADNSEETSPDEEGAQAQSGTDDAGESQDTDEDVDDSEPDAETSDDDSESSDDDVAAADGDVDASEPASGPAGTDGSVASSPAATTAGVDGIFDPSGESEFEDLDKLDDFDEYDEYLGLDNVEESIVDKKLVAIIVAVLVAAGGVLHFVTLDDRGSVFHDIGLLVQGQYQDDLQRRINQTEDDYVTAQRELIPEYGNLFITGSPREALIVLNGEIQYGEIPSGDQWRELRVQPDTVIHDLPIDEDHEIEIHHPGHEPYEITLTENMWEPVGANHGYDLSVSLAPTDADFHREWNARMDADEEQERGDERFYGTVQFNTVPDGAYILINSLFARDEDGNKLTTSAEIEEYWTYDINVADLYEEGILEDVIRDQQALEELFERIENDKQAAQEAIEEAQAALDDPDQEDPETHPDDIEEVDMMEELEDFDARDLDVDEDQLSLDMEFIELEERNFPVDRPLRRGDSIQLIWPDDHDDADDLYDYATMLQREMWECQFKDDDERDQLDDDAPFQENCNYVYEFDMDFFEIADYIERRAAERERVREERHEVADRLDELEEEFAARLEELGHSLDQIEEYQQQQAAEEEDESDGLEDIDHR